MQLFCIGNRPNVLDRWCKILKGRQPQVIRSSELLRHASDGDLVLIHLSSVTSEERQEIFQCKNRFPNLVLVSCTDAPNEEEGLVVLRSGANAYANAFITPSLLDELLKSVLRGDIWAGPELLQKLLRRLLQALPEPLTHDVVESAEPFKELSKREQEVLSVLVKGASNKEIARELDITERTVKAHLSSIFQKTGVQDRMALVLLMNKQPA